MFCKQLKKRRIPSACVYAHFSIIKAASLTLYKQDYIVGCLFLAGLMGL